MVVYVFCDFEIKILKKLYIFYVIKLFGFRYINFYTNLLTLIALIIHMVVYLL